MKKQRNYIGRCKDKLWAFDRNIKRKRLNYGNKRVKSNY